MMDAAVAACAAPWQSPSLLLIICNRVMDTMMVAIMSAGGVARAAMHGRRSGARCLHLSAVLSETTAAVPETAAAMPAVQAAPAAAAA